MSAKPIRLVTVAGPPSVGKTSVIVKTAAILEKEGISVGVIKFDALSGADEALYRRRHLPVTVGLSGGLCPDHFFVSNIDDGLAWGQRSGFDILISESAGLCNRCSPHIAGVPAVCIVDALAGVHTPGKIGPMLRMADLVVITKGDIVSQAERDVFAYRVAEANSAAEIVFCNGITGQGCQALAAAFRGAPYRMGLEGANLRFSMPSAVCPYCVGERAIGITHQRGNVKKMCFGDQA